MRTLLRRFLVVAALMFWQGGFTFYAAVVVPVGQDVLGSHREQGFITRQVTDYLNLAGAVALLPLAWDAAVSGDEAARWRRARWAAWLGMALLLGVLAWLHPRLDALLETETHHIVNPKRFRTEHRWYLWASTLQWGCGVLYALLALRAWRQEDHRVPSLPRGPSGEAPGGRP
jgi:hypothetical protein